MDNTRASMSSVMKNFEIRLSKVTASFSNSPKEENEKGRNPYLIVARLEGRESMAVGLVPSHGAKMANGARLHGSRQGSSRVSEDPKTGCDQKRDTFWYKIQNVYNTEAKKKGFTERTKNMLTGKWTPMNTSVLKFNQLVQETAVHSGENDDDHMSRVHTLYDATVGGVKSAIPVCVKGEDPVRSTDISSLQPTSKVTYLLDVR
ncbi:hypothetical protein Tco_0328048, partial [Tanacetum coccineum]